MDPPGQRILHAMAPLRSLPSVLLPLLLGACSGADAPADRAATDAPFLVTRAQEIARSEIFSLPSVNSVPPPGSRVALPKSPASCPPSPGPGPGVGWAPPMFPCSLTSDCVPGLRCNYQADQSIPTSLPFGQGCGLCESDPTDCPPAQPFWANCGGIGNACPPYISRSVEGRGCGWSPDCAFGTCNYGSPITGPKDTWCGTCE